MRSAAIRQESVLNLTLGICLFKLNPWKDLITTKYVDIESAQTVLEALQNPL